MLYVFHYFPLGSIIYQFVSNILFQLFSTYFSYTLSISWENLLNKYTHKFDYWLNDIWDMEEAPNMNDVTTF